MHKIITIIRYSSKITETQVIKRFFETKEIKSEKNEIFITSKNAI
jgi:hypothetical protein